MADGVVITIHLTAESGGSTARKNSTLHRASTQVPSVCYYYAGVAHMLLVVRTRYVHAAARKPNSQTLALTAVSHAVA